MRNYVKHMDRISDLPDELIHRIMTHLSTKEVAQTSLISKKWKDYLLPSFPFLKFNHVDFLGKDIPHSNPEILFACDRQKFTNSIEDFTEFVDATLNRFSEMNLVMQKFKLIIGITSDLERWSSLIDEWVRLAVESKVKNLHLRLQLLGNERYTLPGTILLAKSLTVLTLYGCHLDHTQFSNAFRFQLLTKLNLELVNLDELAIQKLTGSSPFLEDIVVRNCWGFAHCRFPKLERLKYFLFFSVIEDFESIEITAPSLKECNLYSEIERPLNKIRLVECHNLRSLRLDGNIITDEQFQSLMSELPLLEELRVECYSLSRVTISSQTLKQLSFIECYGLEAIRIDTPNLHHFYFEGEQIPIASINAPCTWKITFSPIIHVDTLWYLKLKKFLGTSGGTKDLFMGIEINEHSFKLRKFRQSSSSPPCEVQSLLLGLDKIPEIECAALMDAYFSVCYPKTLLIETYSNLAPRNSRRYAAFYDTMAKRDAYCCGCTHVKCWRHYLKDVKIQSFSSSEPEVSLEGVPLMNAWPNLPKGCVRFALQWYSDVGQA